ncbi:MAG: outer membrane beta-barrel protein [Bacteroidota bacterium]
MKRTILLLVSLLIVRNMSGQIVKSIGIKEGLSFANQIWYAKSINLTQKTHYRIGLYSGVTLDFFNSKYFNLTTDLSYCQKGCRMEKQSSGNYSSVTSPHHLYSTNSMFYWNFKFHYLSFSPLLKIKYTTNHLIPYALLGLRFDYQLLFQTDAVSMSGPIGNNYNSTIFGMNCGGGIEFKFNYVAITVEYQYQYDFTKVIDSPPSTNNTGQKITNRASIVTLGLKYYLHKKESTK